jgi:hypothetical protein
MATPIPESPRAPCACNPGGIDPGAVVEIGLLLPVSRTEALLALAHRRRQSVGQLLRHLIDRALAEAD